MDKKRKCLGDILADISLSLLKDMGCYEKAFITFADVMNDEDISAIKRVFRKFEDLEDEIIMLNKRFR